jgi:precorrin-6A/cobalt-precorrin-6A reductase
MILLFAGTAETYKVAEALCASSLCVIVSTASDAELDLPSKDNCRRISGRMDIDDIKNIIENKNIKAIVDITHPYAVEITKNAFIAAGDMNVPYFRFSRPSVEFDYEKVFWVDDHKAAAETAFSLMENVLVATGANNLAVYAELAGKGGLEKGAGVFYRILPAEKSFQAARAAGICPESIIAARGPFSKEDNISIIRKFNIGVVVTKDSGAAGGFLEKILAAKDTACHVVIIKRPDESFIENKFSTIENLISAVQDCLS